MQRFEVENNPSNYINLHIDSMPSLTFKAYIGLILTLLHFSSFGANDKPFKKNEFRIGLSRLGSAIEAGNKFNDFSNFSWETFLNKGEQFITGFPFKLPFSYVKYTRHFTVKHGVYVGFSEGGTSYKIRHPYQVYCNHQNIYQIGYTRLIYHPMRLPAIYLNPQIAYRSAYDWIFLDYYTGTFEPAFTSLLYGSLGAGIGLELKVTLLKKITLGIEGNYYYFLTSNDDVWRLQQYPILFNNYRINQEVSTFQFYFGFKF